MPDLLIRLTIPVLVDEAVSAPALTFTRWLPMGDAQAIHLADGELSLKLWFDIKSTWWASHHKEEDLPKTVNVLAHRLYADITVSGVEPELVAYMRHRDFSRHPTSEEKPLQERYDSIAERTLLLTLRTLNRLISYVRSRKGQYWLREYEIDTGRMADFFIRFESKARYEGHDWFRFGPSSVTTLRVQLGPEERYIREEEWDEIRQFVLSSRRTPLARTLLAGAEALAAAGHGRSALTEAVTALEVALYAFAAHAAADKAFGPVLGPRLALQSLRQQVDHMGLSGSVRYLLPVLFPESMLPQHILEGCQTAVAQRQTVVHEGQREVQNDVLRQSLAAIRSLCEFLERVTAPRPGGEASRKGGRP